MNLANRLKKLEDKTSPKKRLDPIPLLYQLYLIERSSGKRINPYDSAIIENYQRRLTAEGENFYYHELGKF